MQVEIKIPELSESVSSGTLLSWRKAIGEAVARDEVVADLETDKVVIEIAAPASGVLTHIQAMAGQEVKSGEVIAAIDTEAKPTAEAQAVVNITPVMPLTETELAKPAPVAEAQSMPATSASKEAFMRPSERRRVMTDEAAPESDQIAQIAPVSSHTVTPTPSATTATTFSERADRRVPMSRLRLRIAERLKEAQNTAAMLTTFNEVNMQPVQAMRKRYQEAFQREHGVRLGLSSFFVKAVCHALKAFPVINAQIEGRDIVYRDYCDIGVAVSSERGLVVPILRNAETMSLAEIEKRIADFATRANNLQLQIEELEGGTFTITNGGVFGSLLSTPIINPPQSAVLGLHKIQDRPVAENGQVIIYPMMYMALSYDHRLIDGRDAVSFLVAVKEAIEDPARLLLEL